MTSSISLKSINELLSESFFIPAYQRGYRWTQQQVLELLEDVLEFQASEQNRSKDGFYCLQPVVVQAKNGSDAWEVVDGQQRLTTLYLIIQYFNLRMIEDERYDLYQLDYETRKGSAAYLESPDEEAASRNVDFYFMYQAYSTIKEWFKDHRSEIRDFEGALLNRVKVIWYELPEADNPVDAFTRLNIGKIPLTNAELVRALFLRSKNFPQVNANLQQLKIAQEWDLMEKSLQNDDFWYFLTTDSERANRIELIFDLITEADQEEGADSTDGLNSFHHFNGILSREVKTAEQLWRTVKDYYMTLEEWYRDQDLFHLVGYLINEGDSILELIDLSRGHSKSEFNHALRLRIWEDIGLDADIFKETNTGAVTEAVDEHLGDLTYGANSWSIKSTLLLFNIASIIENKRSIVRFRFDYFKKENWDIEHIRAVKEERPRSNRDKSAWLDVVCRYFEQIGDENNLRGQAAEMLSAQGYTNDETFENLYLEILEHFGEQEEKETENGIGNLALLDIGTNRGYKNAVFPIKREDLLRKDQAGTFVPLCTRNAFLKAYSKKVDRMLFWGEDDQDCYQKAMSETLTRFFNSNNS